MSEEKSARNFLRLLPLAYCLPLVFAIGAPTIFVTRAIFLQYHPDNFVNDSPTISETASHPPSSLVFAIFFSAVVTCILISWTLNAVRNGWLIERWGQRSPGGFAALNLAAATTGIVAGLFLLSLSIFDLNNGHDIHMASSWGFYIAQVLSIVLDISFVLWLQRPDRTDVRGRAMIAGLILGGSLIFLYLYENKGSAAPEIKYTVQSIYVATEYLLCLLCLAYPATLFFEMRRDLRLFSAAAVKSESLSQPSEA